MSKSDQRTPRNIIHTRIFCSSSPRHTTLQTWKRKKIENGIIAFKIDSRNMFPVSSDSVISQLYMRMQKKSRHGKKNRVSKFQGCTLEETWGIWKGRSQVIIIASVVITKIFDRFLATSQLHAHGRSMNFLILHFEGLWNLQKRGHIVVRLKFVLRLCSRFSAVLVILICVSAINWSFDRYSCWLMNNCGFTCRVVYLLAKYRARTPKFDCVLSFVDVLYSKA